MDMIGKETLEEILEQYTGTLIFVSHDRYFVKKLADRLLVFEDDTVKMFEYGYEEYLDFTEKQKSANENTINQKSSNPAQSVKQKKSFTTPLKEKSKCERALKKCEEKISELETMLENLKAELEKDENITDYIKLGELNEQIETLETELLFQMENWETLSEKLNELLG